MISLVGLPIETVGGSFIILRWQIAVRVNRDDNLPPVDWG
jgi:hypothetical protein